MKSINHIIFGALTDYLGYGLQIDTCLNNNISVKILDISQIYGFPQPNHTRRYADLVVKIKTLEELSDYIQKCDPKETLFNAQMLYEWRFRAVFRLMAKMSQYNFSVFLLGQLPFHAHTSLLQRIKNNLYKLPVKIVEKVLTKIFFKFHYLRKQNVLFYVGTPPVLNAHDNLAFPINFYDYDRFLESPESRNDGYAVFLDDGLFQHPDDKIVGNVVTTELVKSYQKSLNDFFDKIEKEKNIEVIVSPHPRVHYPDNYFGNRKLATNLTRETVQNANMVFCHCSSSISFAICYNKPLYFLVDDNISSFSKKYQPLESFITNMAITLNRPVIQISREFELNFEKEIDTKIYEDFKMNYLTTRATEHMLSKNVFLNYLKNIFKS